MRLFKLPNLFAAMWFLLLMFAPNSAASEKQITHSEHGHILTNIGVWSSDSQWIVYDRRSDPAGSEFDGTRIERVHVESGRVELLYESTDDANCGVVTFSPKSDTVVFIHGPEQPTSDWQYAAFHRRGVMVTAGEKTADANGNWNSSRPKNLDARNIISPFTPGALRGGTHVHTFSGDGNWVAFTYEDHVLETNRQDDEADRNQRNVGVSVPARGVTVPDSHRRNHDGSHFSILVTRTVNEPRFGSDEISKAFSDAWVGTNGYVRSDGSRQEKAIAFQGEVRTKQGHAISEVFIVDVPNDVTRPADDGPLEGTATKRPMPPRNTVQRRLTFTAERKHPGIQGVRHWLRSSPDGSQIAFLMRDEQGISQMWTVSPNGGVPRQVTRNKQGISSAFSWTPDGKLVAHTMDNSVCVTQVDSGKTIRLTRPQSNKPLRPEACVVSPDGMQVAYVREVKSTDKTWNQIFVKRITNEADD